MEWGDELAYLAGEEVGVATRSTFKPLLVFLEANFNRYLENKSIPRT